MNSRRVTRAVKPSFPSVCREQALAGLGRELVRFEVPDLENARMLGDLSRLASMPLVAGAHLDYRIALARLDHPLAKVRIDRSNIGEDWKVREVISKTSDKAKVPDTGARRISCPKRGRASLDVHGLPEQVSKRIQAIRRSLPVPEMSPAAKQPARSGGRTSDLQEILCAK